MRRLLTGLTILLFLEGTAMAQISNHPNWAKINTFTESIVGTIKTYQDQFFTQYKRYFQGLPLLGADVKPSGIADITVVNTSKPSDFNLAWKDFAPTIFKNTLKIPIQIRIDVYESPHGWGWILRADVWYDGLGSDAYGNSGDHWAYQHNEGPDVDESQIWDEWFIRPDEF